MDNSKQTLDYLSFKFDKSQKTYNKILTSDDLPHDFLSIYEYHNVWPIYPRPVIINIYNSMIKTESDLDITNFKQKLEKDGQMVMSKVNEWDLIFKKTNTKMSNDKVRRFFDYEIRDKISTIIVDSYITNAWCKMYEILVTYNFFMNLSTVTAFHICEHPGAFIYAIRDYIRLNHPDTKYNFIFQSLKPVIKRSATNSKQTFRAEGELLTTFRQNLDYGASGTGDITDIHNILYYRKKYFNKTFNLITSDCGLDCSDDFNQQESTLFSIYLGAFLASAGLSSKGTNYICKMFTFYTDETIQLLNMYCMVYQTVDIVKLLTTKSGSAEIYVICRNFKYDKSDPEFENLYNRMITYYKSYKSDKKEKPFGIPDSYFMEQLKLASEITTKIRIMNINMLLFRIANTTYIKQTPTVKSYVQSVVKYYTDYFINYIKLSTNLTSISK